MATGTRRTNDFCWINIVAPRPAEAMEFFGRVLGWTYFEMPGIGHGMRVGGRDVGGLFDIEGPNTPPGMKPVIGVMLKVDNADAACKKVTSLGGTAKPAFDVMEQGRMAVCFDPNGGEFDVWEPKKMLGTDADSSLHGAPSWFEAMTTDVERATDFYSGLFGWTPEVMPMPGSTYTVFKNGGTDVAGMTKITPEMAGLRPHWTTYFTVKDADEAAREAVALGARLHVALHDIPGIGRFCGITSPQGVMFNVIQYIR
jgi:predicted enzyme related to lactoylglutathione lyase